MSARAAGGYRCELDHGAGVTPIFVGAGSLGRPPAEILAALAGRRVFVLAAEPVLALHPRALDPLLAGADAVVLPLADGEPAKTLAGAGELWSELVVAGGRRDSVVLAFGGGSVGDLAGFVAAAFLRGVDLLQVPTTLLAQVDAAIGGKTAVNLPAAKNAVGAFHHPIGVVSDTALLATLSRAELRGGLVEAIKMAALLDLELLDRIERDLAALLAGDGERLAPVVAAAARVKARLVARDPREHGARKLLNFGHTLGHALEAAAGYGGLRHGDAVAWGMRFALELAARRGLPAADRERLEALIDRLEPPPLPPLDPAAVLAHLGRDKKARRDGLVWVLPSRLGHGQVVEDVPAGEVETALAAFLGGG